MRLTKGPFEYMLISDCMFAPHSVSSPTPILNDLHCVSHDGAYFNHHVPLPNYQHHGHTTLAKHSQRTGEVGKQH